MFGYHRFQSAHFIGHSFGSLVVAQVLKFAPELISKLSLLDPVCFSLLKVTFQLVGVTFREPQTIMDAAIAYFALRELWTTHAMVRRIWWQENEIVPSELL